MTAPPPPENPSPSLAGGLRKGGFFGSEDFLSSLFHSTQEGDAEPAPLPIPESLAAGWEGPPTVGPYELLEQLGRGGMGVVYRARDVKANREVALKVVLAGEGDARRLDRFRREGRVTAGLDHPGIVRVHSAGEVEGLPYLAYELVEDARSLTDAFDDLDVPGRVRLVIEAARGLGFAHEHGVVHRDVKPDNILVGRDGRVRVADFGLAFATGVDRLTRTGAFMGTPLFMSPEQITGGGKDLEAATDVWALGVILYVALTNQIPFDGATLPELGVAIAKAEPTPPRDLDPSVSKELEAVCLRALARAPGDRYRDGTVLADDLEQALAGRSWASLASADARVTRLLAALAAISAVLLVSVLVALVTTNREPREGTEVERQDASLRVTILSPEDGTETWSDRVEVRAVVMGGPGPLRVRVGERRLRAVPREPFSETIRLDPGENRIVVVASGQGDDPVERSIGVVRRVPPPWFMALDSERRPPLPLPAGVVFGADERVYVNEADGSELVWIPPDTFRMGMETLQPPVHPVRVTRGFFLGKYELTWEKFERYVAATGRSKRTTPKEIEGPYGAHPVRNVSWADAQSYCAWAGLRLPSEAEWELAARGPELRTYPWGDAPPSNKHVNIEGDDPFPTTCPVTAFPEGQTPDGVFHMAGNVWEWVWDYGGHYTTAPTVDPLGPDPDAFDAIWKTKESQSPMRVLRGAFYGVKDIDEFDMKQYRVESLQGAFREGRTPTKRRKDCGFRVARWVDEPLQPAWTVSFFPSLADPLKEQTEWAARARKTAIVGFKDRRGLALPFGRNGPSELLGVSTAVQEAALPYDGFGTLAEGVVELPDPRWAITVVADDAVRVWANGELIINEWRLGATGVFSGRLRDAGTRPVRLRIEHFDHDNRAQLSAFVHRW